MINMKFGRNSGLAGSVVGAVSDMITGTTIDDRTYSRNVQFRDTRGTMYTVSWLPHVKFEDTAIVFVTGTSMNTSDSEGDIRQNNRHIYTTTRALVSYDHGTVELVRVKPVLMREQRVIIYTQGSMVLRVPDEISLVFTRAVDSGVARPTVVHVESEEFGLVAQPFCAHYMIRPVTCVVCAYHIEYIDLPTDHVYKLVVIQDIEARGLIENCRFDPVDTPEFKLTSFGAYTICSTELGQRSWRTRGYFSAHDISTAIEFIVTTRPIPKFEFDPIIVEADTPELVRLQARPMRPQIVSADAENAKVVVDNDSVTLTAHRNTTLVVKCLENNIVMVCRVPVHVYPRTVSATLPMCPKKEYVYDADKTIEFVVILDGQRKVRVFSDALQCTDLVFARVSGTKLHIHELYATCTLCVFAGPTCVRLLCERVENPLVLFVENGASMRQYGVKDMIVSGHGVIHDGNIVSTVVARGAPVDKWPSVLGRLGTGHELDITPVIIDRSRTELVSLHAPYGITHMAVYTTIDPEQIINVEHVPDSAVILMPNRKTLTVSGPEPMCTLLTLTMSSGRKVRIECAFYDPKTPIESRLAKIGPDGPEPEHIVMYEWHADGSAPTVYRNDPPIIRQDWTKYVRSGIEYALDDGRRFPQLAPGESREHVQTYMDRGVERKHTLIVKALTAPSVPRDAIIVNGRLTWIGPCAVPDDLNVGPLHTTIDDVSSPWHGDPVQIRILASVTVTAHRELPFFYSDQPLYVKVPKGLTFFATVAATMSMMPDGTLEIVSQSRDFCVYGIGPTTLALHLYRVDRSSLRMTEGGFIRYFTKQTIDMQDHIVVPPRTGTFTCHDSVRSQTGQVMDFDFEIQVQCLPRLFVGRNASVIMTLDDFASSACPQIRTSHVNVKIPNDLDLWYYNTNDVLCVVPVSVADVYAVELGDVEIGVPDRRTLSARFGGHINVDLPSIGATLNAIGDTLTVLVKKPGYQMISLRTNDKNKMITIWANGISGTDRTASVISVHKSSTHETYTVMLPTNGPVDGLGPSVERTGQFLRFPGSETSAQWSQAGRQMAAKFYACRDIVLRGVIGKYDFGGQVRLVYVNGVRCAPGTLDEIERDTMPVPAQFARYDWSKRMDVTDGVRVFDIFYIMDNAQYSATIRVERYVATVRVRRGEAFKFDDTDGDPLRAEWLTAAGPTLVGPMANNYFVEESYAPMKITTLYSSSVVQDFEIRQVVTHNADIIECETHLVLSSTLSRGKNQTVRCVVGDTVSVGHIKRAYLCGPYDLPDKQVDVPEFIKAGNFVPTVPMSVKYWLVFDRRAALYEFVSDKIINKNVNR